MIGHLICDWFLDYILVIIIIRIPFTLFLSVFFSGHHDHLRSVMQNNSMNNNISNPRLPPYPHPTMLIPLAQIKHALSIPGLGGSNTGPGSGAGTGSKASSRSMTQTRLDRLCVVTCFAPSRGWVCSSPGLMREKPGNKFCTMYKISKLYLYKFYVSFINRTTFRCLYNF